MTFYNENFPDDISYGSKGGPKFSTTIIRLKSGHEQRNVNWQYPLHMYDVSYGVKTQAQMAALRSFFMAMFGQAHTFRFKDWHDYTTNADGVSASAWNDAKASAVAVNANSGTTWQIVKSYGIGSAAFRRNIKYPIAATVSAGVAGVEVSTNRISVDASTGYVTVTGVSVTVRHIYPTNPCIVSTYVNTVHKVGQFVAFAEVSGMAEINGQRHEILALTSRGFTIDLDATSGYTAYVSGTAQRAVTYPTSAEASIVTIGCEFDVPCRFDSDVFDPVHDDYDITQLQIQVKEVRE